MGTRESAGRGKAEEIETYGKVLAVRWLRAVATLTLVGCVQRAGRGKERYGRKPWGC